MLWVAEIEWLAAVLWMLLMMMMMRHYDSQKQRQQPLVLFPAHESSSPVLEFSRLQTKRRLQ